MTCRMPGCDEENRTDGMDRHANAFCSPQCEVTYDKRKIDAKEARLADIEEAREEDHAP